MHNATKTLTRTHGFPSQWNADLEAVSSLRRFAARASGVQPRRIPPHMRHLEFGIEYALKAYTF